MELGKCVVTAFPDGETFVKIEENVRGEDVFVIQSTSPPTNHHLMEMFIMMDALRRASATRITAVLPFYGYARQDRKDQPRVPITAKLVANLIVAAGANRVLTMDLHASQLQGFFDIPVDHLYAINVLSEYFKERQIEDLVIVSPDVGGIKMARAYAKRLNAGLAIVDKRRMSPEKTEVMHILGDVKDKNVVMVDDIIATAGSLTEGVRALKGSGAKGIYMAASHGVLSGPAKERIADCKELLEVVITNSIPLKDGAQHPKI